MSNYKLATINQQFIAETIARTGSEQLLEKAGRNFVGLYNEEENWYIPLRASLSKKSPEGSHFDTPFTTTNKHFRRPGLDFQKALYVPGNMITEIRNTLPTEQSKFILEHQEEIQSTFENYVMSIENLEPESNAYQFSTVPLFPEGIEKIQKLAKSKAQKSDIDQSLKQSITEENVEKTTLIKATHVKNQDFTSLDIAANAHRMFDYLTELGTDNTFDSTPLMLEYSAKMLGISYGEVEQAYMTQIPISEERLKELQETKQSQQTQDSFKETPEVRQLLGEKEKISPNVEKKTIEITQDDILSNGLNEDRMMRIVQLLSDKEIVSFSKSSTGLSYQLKDNKGTGQVVDYQDYTKEIDYINQRLKSINTEVNVDEKHQNGISRPETLEVKGWGEAKWDSKEDYYILPRYGSKRNVAFTQSEIEELNKSYIQGKVNETTSIATETKNENTQRMDTQLVEFIRNKDLSALSKHMKEGLKNYLDSETYKNYLNFVAQFHKYSSHNIQMILAQKPDASLIAGAGKWKKDFGRYPAKGSKALYIYSAPKQYTLKDENGNPKLDEQGNEIKRSYYKLLPVYDVSQTAGKELPKPVHELTGKVENYESLFLAINKCITSPVRFEKLEGDTHGYFNPSQNEIVLKSQMSEKQTIKTLIHEATHSELHTNSQARFGDDTYRKQEFEAESVAYVVTQHYGIDSSDYSFGYLTSWGMDDLDLKNLKETMIKVQEKSHDLIERIDKNLEKVKDNVVEKSSLEQEIERATSSQLQTQVSENQIQEVDSQGKKFSEPSTQF
jgi:hypothetical protein